MARSKNLGFTLIEILVSVTILSIVMTIISSILFLSLRSNSKTRSLKEIKQSGDATVSIIKEFVRGSESVSCGSTSINAIDSNGETTIFYCSEGKIASNSADITNDLVECSSFTAACSGDTGGQLVEFSFLLTPTVDYLGSGAMEFSGKVFFRER